MKTLIILLLLMSAVAFAAASDTVTVKPPVRTLDHQGRQISPEWVPLFYEKDCDQNGWRFEIDEWLPLRVRMSTARPMVPRLYKDPDHGSNGGYEIG